MSGEWEGTELLQPITPDQPCGQNLEDTPLLASFDAFRLFGQASPLDPPPEWGAIRDTAAEALAKSKDLRLLAHLGTALLRTDGLPAFAHTLTIASEWLATYWAQVYPLVDEDAILRRNALNCFSDQMAVVDGLRRVPLVNNGHGRFSLRDLEMASGQVQAGASDTPADAAQITAAFAAMPIDDLTRLQQTTAGAIGALKRIDATMRETAGTNAAPTFDPLSAQLSKIDRVLKSQLAARPDGPGVNGNDEAGVVATGAGVGPIRSRQDAIRALDAVAQFFRQTEPSSPIPLVVERAKRLVSKDFLEVLREIAPDALAQARAAGGLRDGE